MAKTPFPAYHTYSVIKVTKLSSHIEYERWWATGLMQKIKDQALILKLGKSTSQEINPNCCPRFPGAFGNWESRQLSAHYVVGKRTKNNPPPPFRVVRVIIEITTLREI